jgi:biopolymer transport protein ExbD
MEVGSGASNVKSEPNVVPMIDVMLVLLIIFMVVLPALTAGFTANPPQGINLKSHPDEYTDQVHGIDRDGNYEDNKRPIPLDSIGPILKAIYANRDDRAAKVDKNRQIPDRRHGSRVQERRARGWSGVGPGARDQVLGRGRPAERKKETVERESDLHGRNGRQGWRTSERTKRRSDDRRAAGAADHLHDHDPHVPGRHRSAAAGPEATGGRSATTENRPDRSGGSPGTVVHDQQDAGLERGSAGAIQEIYDPRPDKILFVKGDPNVKYQKSSGRWTWRAEVE